MTLLTGWPDMQDDDGTYEYGTPWDRSVSEAMKTAVQGVTHSAGNPAVSPKDIIDEVVYARGNLVNLEGRLENVIDRDGNFIGAPAGVPDPEDIVGTLFAGNQIANDTFLIWTSATKVEHWTLAVGTLARATVIKKIGTAAAQVTSAGPVSRLTNSILDAGVIAGGEVTEFIKGLPMGIGCWVYSSSANTACILVQDGVNEIKSDFHPGDSTWHWLSAQGDLSDTPTKLEFHCSVEAAGSGIFSAATAIFSSIAPTRWIPARKNYGVLHFPINGDLEVANRVGKFAPARPLIVKDFFSGVETAPTGQAAIFDLKTWDGAAYTSMFATPPQIAAGAYRGGGRPDGSFFRRCMTGTFDAALSAGGLLSLDVTQVGNVVAGADAIVEVRVLQYARELEEFLAFNDL